MGQNPAMMGGYNPPGGMKGSPMGTGGDPSMPLGGGGGGGQNQGPPGGGGGFKSSQFMAPTMNDPNYSHQYALFQQQLYSTNTRSQQQQQQQTGAAGQPGNFIGHK